MRHRRFMVIGALVVAVLSTLLAVAPGQTAGQHGLRVIAPGGRGQAFGENGVVQVYGLPVYLASIGQSTEFHVGRRDFDSPVTVREVSIVDGESTTRRLPANLLDGFSGFRGGLRIVVKELDGDVVTRTRLPLCPGGYTRQRVDPSGPDQPIYPMTCGGMPFTLGTIWGVEQGWAVGLGSDFGISFEGDQDAYRVQVRISKQVARALGIPKRERGATVRVDVEQFTGPIEQATGRPADATTPPAAQSTTERQRPVTRGDEPAPAAGTLPDLISLPAFWISVTADGDGLDRLNFAANEWNAGPSPMVVEGFRSAADSEIMDAYQIFYRNGRPVGSRRTGTMEYHAGEEHNHWHFLDFANYQLVDDAGTVVSATGKQSWCLAPTDPIDLRVPNATFNPGNTDLGSSCGGPEALWIRETMPVGWGDTYSQFQTWAIDVTDVPNGTYRIKVSVNPNGNLFETRTDNNISYRTVILGGTPGARTVEVPPYGLVDSEADNPFVGLPEG